MTKNKISKIVLIGAGRLASNFAVTAKERGYSVLQVYNRTEKTGKELAGKVSGTFIRDLNEMDTGADLYAVAVSDAAIKEVAEKIHLKDQLIIHFSGTADLHILKDSSRNYGILYPPQSFNIKNKPGFLDIPLCLEANNTEAARKLSGFAGTLSGKIFPVNSYQRKIIHLSAIFAGNFTNFMYTVAEDLLSHNNLPTDLIRPIIRKTASNADSGKTFMHQTGPAIREDLATLQNHLDFLSGNPEYKEIYRIISESIIKYKHFHDEL